MTAGLVQKFLDAAVVLGSAAYGKRQLRRFLSDAAIVIWLAVMAIVSASVMFIGCFYAAYNAMLHYGMAPLGASLIVLLLFAAVTASFIAVTLLCLRRFQRRSPLVSDIEQAVEAFIDGLMTKV